LIPFEVDLRDKVKPIEDFHNWLFANEGPGILNWLIAGFLDRQEHGFAEPECVEEFGRQ
jgi:phage/plasmid-associated DNA primase